MKVVLRADASRHLGAGHVMRCLTLADELVARGAQCHFLCRASEGHLGSLIQNRGYPVGLMPDGTNWEEDAQACQSWMSQNDMDHVDWLVVDHYQLEQRWEQVMRPWADRLMVLDDLADRPHDCDLLLDQNPLSSSRYATRVPPACVCMIGPAYALLRPGFRRHRPVAPRQPGRIERLLVFFGGGDESNETGKVLEVLANLNLVVDVVVGAAHAHRDALADQCGRNRHCRLHCQVDDMAALMARADLALGATGVSTWERACVGLPALVVSVADNQHPIAQAAQEAGLLTWLGPAWDVDVQTWRQALEQALGAPKRLAAQSAAGMALVDGLGVGRVADRMAA